MFKRMVKFPIELNLSTKGNGMSHLYFQSVVNMRSHSPDVSVVLVHRAPKYEVHFVFGKQSLYSTSEDA